MPDKMIKDLSNSALLPCISMTEAPVRAHTRLASCDVCGVMRRSNEQKRAIWSEAFEWLLGNPHLTSLAPVSSATASNI
jgi:hypothetical protein